MLQGVAVLRQVANGNIFRHNGLSGFPGRADPPGFWRLDYLGDDLVETAAASCRSGTLRPSSVFLAFRIGAHVRAQ